MKTVATEQCLYTNSVSSLGLSVRQALSSKMFIVYLKIRAIWGLVDGSVSAYFISMRGPSSKS